MNNINKATEYLTTIFSTTEEILSEWNWNTSPSIQCSTLLETLSSKLSLTDKQIKSIDNMVRFYIKADHPVYYLSQGAHGGIKRIADKNSRTLSAGLKAAIKADVVAQTAISKKPEVNDTDSSTPFDDDFDFEDD